MAKEKADLADAQPAVANDVAKPNDVDQSTQVSGEKKKGFKLDVKRTTYIGLAFFTILMLWQVYNTYCPLFLSDFFVAQFGGTSSDHAYLVGIIMAMDNILALFMLPLFGAWSDRTKSKLGKRMPFITAGVVLAVIFFPLIPIMFIYNQMVWMIIIMAIILLAMNIYRSPAVALMPDITPKPLRSKANAIINVIGYVGAIFAGALAMVFSTKTGADGRLVYDPNTIWIPFAITAVFMILALVILLLKIRENKLAVEMADELARGEKEADTTEAIEEDKPLTGVNKRNMIVLLLSIFLWFFAFNAIETFGSTYGVQVLGESSGWWGTAVIVMTVCSLIGFFPGAFIADKLGRRNTILLGLGIMIVMLGIAMISSLPHWLYFILIGIAGVGWAWVNVNSYPMVVEMASKKNIGKLTGWYYAASMLAQSITPICIGFLFGALGYEFMFPYATIFSVIALILFLFYVPAKKHKTANGAAAEDNKTVETDADASAITIGTSSGVVDRTVDKVDNPEIKQKEEVVSIVQESTTSSKKSKTTSNKNSTTKTDNKTSTSKTTKKTSNASKDKVE